MCKIKVSFRKEHKPPKKVNYDCSAMKTDDELQKRYAIEVRNRFSGLVEEDDSHRATETLKATESL